MENEGEWGGLGTESEESGSDQDEMDALDEDASHESVAAPVGKWRQVHLQSSLTFE